LNDSGTGSLRACLNMSGARVVVFDVSGTITLASKIAVSTPFLTVAGQTAPSPGILIKGAGISLRTHDVLIQHLRIRTGVTGAGNNDDAETLGPSSYNVVWDHISGSWSGDEDFSTWYGGLHDVTVANSIFGENLGSGSVLVGDSTRNMAILGTLLIHNWDRNPYFKGYVTGVFANSVVYNYSGNNAAYVADPSNGGPSQVSFVGNVFLPGPSTPGGKPIQVYATNKTGVKVYVADNSFGRGAVPPADPWSLVYNQFGAGAVATTPQGWPPGLAAQPNGQVLNAVLANAGAWPAARDAVDLRYVADVRNGTGGKPSGTGGPWPAIPAVTSARTIPANPNADDDGDGYTNLENWLQALARAAEGR
jgi:hypothetical protein